MAGRAAGRRAQSLRSGPRWGRGRSRERGSGGGPSAGLQREAPCAARNKRAHTSWNVDTILEGKRSGFARRGPKERLSKETILQAQEGNHDWIYGVLKDNLVSPDVADARGYTVLAAAAVSAPPPPAGCLRWLQGGLRPLGRGALPPSLSPVKPPRGTDVLGQVGGEGEGSPGPDPFFPRPGRERASHLCGVAPVGPSSPGWPLPLRFTVTWTSSTSCWTTGRT